MESKAKKKRKILIPLFLWLGGYITMFLLIFLIIGLVGTLYFVVSSLRAWGVVNIRAFKNADKFLISYWWIFLFIPISLLLIKTISVTLHYSVLYFSFFAADVEWIRKRFLVEMIKFYTNKLDLILSCFVRYKYNFIKKYK